MRRLYFLLLLFSGFTGLAQPSNRIFTDLDSAYKYKDAVRYLALNNGIVPGTLKYAEEMPNLESLSLSSGRLSEIPAEIYSLKHLRRLIISRIKIQKIPKELTLLKNLQQLEISGTSIQEIPDWLYKMDQLQILNLSYNEISYINNNIRLSPALRYLNLSNNQLTELPESFSRSNSLERLNISNNRFRVFPGVLISLPTLKSLELNNNLLTQLPNLSAMPALETLFISRNPLSDEGFSRFPPSLKSFYAYNCNFSALPRSLKDCQNLRTLIITRGNITAIPGWIAGLDSLKWINLEHNKITSLPSFFNRLQLLEKLILNHNHIDSIPPEIFEIPALTEFSISNNPVRHIPNGLHEAKSLKYVNIEKTQVPKEEYVPLRKTRSGEPVTIAADDKYSRYDELRNRKGSCYVEDEIFDSDVFTNTEMPATFRGSTGYAFFNQNLRFPNIAAPQFFSDTVVLQFIVKPWGGITKITPLQSGHAKTTEEAIRLLKLSCPYWSPGLSGGRELLTWCTVQFVFTRTFDENNALKTQLSVSSLPQKNRYIKRH